MEVQSNAKAYVMTIVGGDLLALVSIVAAYVLYTAGLK